jgi:hypothetical protein
VTADTRATVLLLLRPLGKVAGCSSMAGQMRQTSNPQSQGPYASPCANL